MASTQTVRSAPLGALVTVLAVLAAHDAVAQSRGPSIPFATILDLASLARAPRPLENAFRLDADRGLTRCDFSAGEAANGLYLEVSGRVVFEQAVVLFASGDRDTLDLRRVVRGSGLYELMGFAADREVAGVTLRARARSREAWVGLRLGR